MRSHCVLALAVCAAATSAAYAADHRESVHGDLSNNRLAPTPITASLGDNHISGTIISSDLDYFVVHIPGQMRLSAIVLDDYQSSNTKAFIGMQTGTTFSVDPANALGSLLLGYTHYGLETPIGENLLDDLAAQPDAIGFTAPLQPGDYVFWLNQTEPALTTFGFNFVVVPEPSRLGMVAFAGLLIAGRRRRHPCDHGVRRFSRWE